MGRTGRNIRNKTLYGKRKKFSGKILIMAAAAVFVSAVVVLIMFFFGGLPENSKEKSAKTSSVYEQEKTKGEISQVIISLGENPGDVIISWKGSKQNGSIFRISDDKDKLSLESETIKAEKHKVLKGKYYRYAVRIKNLKQGEKYFYEIGDESTFVYSDSFTVPDAGGETKFLYLGDVQFENSVDEYTSWGSMVEKIYSQNPDIDFAVIGGDMVNVPTDEKQWESFLDSCKAFSKLPLMTVSGNHEGVSSNKTYKGLFSMPENGPEPVYSNSGSNEQPESVNEELNNEFYYFDYGKCRFIMMDSSFLTEERKQKLGQGMWSIMEKSVENWLKKITSENKKTWTVAVIHHPVYGFHDKDTVSPNIRKLWEPVLKEGGVDMVFCGHQHMYMRTRDIDGIVYVMGNSGNRKSEYYNGYNSPSYSRAVYGEGPNYQIVTVKSSKLEMVSYDEKGLVIDETIINKGLWFHILELFSSYKIVV